MALLIPDIVKLPQEMPKAERINIVAPVINQLIWAFESRTLKEGVETFQEKLTKRISAANLSEFEDIHAESICIHPDNREKAMVVPVDSHELLLRITEDGWAWTQCKIMESGSRRMSHMQKNRKV